VLQLAHVFRARVVDVAPESIIVEITGTEDKIDGLLEVLRPYGILEMVRTGRVAMSRGAKAASAAVNGGSLYADEYSQPEQSEDVSYSV
jgi:acetolactate synthase I/III small subunit